MRNYNICWPCTGRKEQDLGRKKNSMIQKGNVGKSVGNDPEEQVKEEEF